MSVFDDSPFQQTHSSFVNSGSTGPNLTRFLHDVGKFTALLMHPLVLRYSNLLRTGPKNPFCVLMDELLRVKYELLREGGDKFVLHP